jgi:hypothetical protein
MASCLSLDFISTLVSVRSNSNFGLFVAILDDFVKNIFRIPTERNRTSILKTSH